MGKRFQDAGLRDLCIESGVIADGSIFGVMDGRKYKRVVRLHKLEYELLTRLAWKGFLSWLQSNHTDDVVHVDETLKTFSNLCKDVSQVSLKQVFQNMSCARIMYMFEVYLEFLRVGNGSLSTFWLSYLDMVEILLGLLRASREGHWMLHLASIRAMIPWCFHMTGITTHAASRTTMHATSRTTMHAASRTTMHAASRTTMHAASRTTMLR